MFLFPKLYASACLPQRHPRLYAKCLLYCRNDEMDTQNYRWSRGSPGAWNRRAGSCAWAYIGMPSGAGRSGEAELMTAVIYRCYGSPDVLEVTEVEKPVPADNEVLVKVSAASVNPLDWHYMRGSPYLMRLGSGIGAPDDITNGRGFLRNRGGGGQGRHCSSNRAMRFSAAEPGHLPST